VEEKILRFLRGELDQRDTGEIEAWRRESPEHEAVFRQIKRLYEFRVLLQPTLYQAAPPAAERLMRRARARGRWFRSLAFWVSATAATLLAVGAVTRVMGSNATGPLLRAAEFVTEPVEASTVQLGDGTVVRLGPESHLTLVSDRRERRVSFRGQAFFAVARDEAHPFKVSTDRADLVVRGTRFHLEARGEQLRVSVVEGVVELRAGSDTILVHGGQVGQTVPGGRAIVGRIDSVQVEAPWMRRFVAFESTPLRIVADEFQRRFGMRVVILDPALAEETVTIWSNAGSAMAILNAICVAVDAECSVEDSLAVLR
jgi:transmembrane sensor